MMTDSRTHPSLLDAMRRESDEDAWRRFYARYVEMLYSFARRIGLRDDAAGEVVAETLATFYSGFRRGMYEPSKGRLRAWLCGIARHCVLRVHERRARERRHQPMLEDLARKGEAPASGAGVERSYLERAFDEDWQLERLNQALAVLRGECHVDTYQAFDLYVLKEWPVRKVAEFLRIKPNAVYLAKSRCVGRLRRIIAEMIQDED